jgi:hypothetical protein
MARDWKSAAIAGMGSLLFLFIGSWMSRVDASQDKVPELTARIALIETKLEKLDDSVSGLGTGVGELTGEMRMLRQALRGRRGERP